MELVTKASCLKRAGQVVRHIARQMSTGLVESEIQSLSLPTVLIVGAMWTVIHERIIKHYYHSLIDHWLEKVLHGSTPPGAGHNSFASSTLPMITLESTHARHRLQT